MIFGLSLGTIILILQVIGQLIDLAIQLIKQKQPMIGQTFHAPPEQMKAVNETYLYTSTMAREDNIKQMHTNYPTIPEPILRLTHEYAYWKFVRDNDTKHYSTWELVMKAFCSSHNLPHEFSSDDARINYWTELGKKTMRG